MKITNKLFKKMERCCKIQNVHKKLTKEIEKELKGLGIDTEQMRNDDVALTDFIDYGIYVDKEELEKALDKYAKGHDNEGGEDGRRKN